LVLKSSTFGFVLLRYWVKHIGLQLSSNLNGFCVI
jgi:hypothetical protein